MIPAEAYYPTYLVVVFIMTIICLSSYRYERSVSFIRKERDWAMVFTVLMTLFIGFRPISDVFADMPGYSMAMIDHRFEGVHLSWDNNYFFVSMMAFLSSHGASPRTPILILAFIYFIGTYIAVRKLFPNDVLLAMLACWGAFTTFGGATNGLKAGCAAALFLIAIAYRNKKYISVVFLFLSLGFHHSMQLPIIAFLICSMYKNTRVFLLFWVICFLLSVFHVTSFMDIFATFTDDHGADYLLTAADSIDSVFSGKTGFRFDFVLYSFVPIVLGYYTLYKRKSHSEEYQFVLNLYLLINAVWMLCMYAQFTNRIASLSWFLYPVLLLYPFLKMDWGESRIKMLYYVSLGQLSFIFIMLFI